MLKRVVLVGGVILSAALYLFAVHNYRDASAVAEENLRGVALSISSAVENVAFHDPSLHALQGFHPADLAYLALTDHRGVYRFHSNGELIGTKAADQRQATPGEWGGRVTLGTGEVAYQYLHPIHLPEGTLQLRLTLHTYRADMVVRKAKLNMAILFALLGGSWILSAILYRFAAREKRHQAEMARREELARLGEMGAMLAHEIRNPLAGIKGFAQVIGKKPADERNAAFAARIVEETLRLEHLVFNLLSYARTGPLSPTPIPARELLKGAVALVRGEREAKNIDVSLTCAEDVRISGDREKLTQVMLNLLQNALQAVGEHGKISVAVEACPSGVTIAVTDNGAGMDKETLARVFEPFFTTKAKGTGLGLAICRKIMEAHGGTIAITGAPGQGTRVALTFPAAMEA